MKTKNTNKGITLIALVITIIVMLILVAVTITMAVNGGLFEYASNAGAQTNAAVEAEQEFANLGVNMTYTQLIDKYSGGSEGEDIIGMDGEVFSCIYNKTQEYKDNNGDIAVIPEGFSVGKSKGINTVDEGLVIQDKEGNQFVWIPVEYIATGNLDSNKLDSGFVSTFKRNTIDENYTEPYESGYSEGSGKEEAKDFYDMMRSVQKNKGFYVGRYEAGIEQTKEPRTIWADEKYEAAKENGESSVVVKRDCYPYTVVSWGNKNCTRKRSLL